MARNVTLTFCMTLTFTFDLGCQTFWPFHKLQYETSWKSVGQIEQTWPKMFFWPSPLTLDIKNLLVFLWATIWDKSEVCRPNRTKVMAKNVIFSFYMTLTFTFDLGYQKIYSSFYKLQYKTSWRSAQQMEPKLWPTRKNAKKWVIFYSCHLDLDPMTLIYELDLDIMEMYLHAKNSSS